MNATATPSPSSHNLFWNPSVAVIVGMVLRLWVATWNGLWGPSLGAEFDALGFHERASQVAQRLDFLDFRIGYTPYVNALGSFYYLFTPSLLLGSLVSCAAWLGSAAFMLKTMELLRIGEANRTKAMFLFALLPSSALLTSVTLREPFQLLFLNATVYFAIKIYDSGKNIYWLPLLAASVGTGVLHGVMFVMAVFMIIATMTLATLRKSANFLLVRIVFLSPILIVVMMAGLSIFTQYSYNLDEGLGVSVESYQQGGLRQEGRTEYKENVDISGPVGLLTFIPIAFLQYLFEPTPWRASTSFDMAVLAENALRGWLLWMVGTTLFKLPARRRMPVVFIFTIWLATEAIWAMGTVNWGTAVRHHIPTFGLLLIAAFAHLDKSSTDDDGQEVPSDAPVAIGTPLSP